MQTADGVTTISEERFEQFLKDLLGREWDRALKLFRNFGPHLSQRVTGSLLYASERGKVEDVLGILERHYDEHLQYQHPDIRGEVSISGANPTTSVFDRICRDTLGLSEASS